MTVYTQISQNNWPSSKNQFDDYLVYSAPYNQALGLSSAENKVGSKLIRPQATATVYGNTSISPAQSKYYGSSAYFDGTGDFLYLPPSGGYGFAGDFTIEYWTYFTAHEVNMRQVSSINYYTAGFNGNWYFGLNQDSGGELVFFSYNGQGDGLSVFLDIATPALNTWHHVAASRTGTTLRLFLNGTQMGSGTFDRNLIDGAVSGLAIGKLAAGLGGSYGDQNGYLQDFRIYNGIGKYTSNFTPPGPILGSA